MLLVLWHYISIQFTKISKIYFFSFQKKTKQKTKTTTTTTPQKTLQKTKTKTQFIPKRSHFITDF